MPGMVHNIRIVFGAQTQPSITIQQSDYNSRTIQAACFTSSGTPMDFSDTTVTVVYNAGADPTKEYPVTVEGNILSFTIPGLAAQTAGSWSMQIFIYWAGSLLHSAEIPYTVLKTITPGTGGDDPVPALVLLIQQAQDAIGECNKATENANKTVANIEKKLADGDFIGKKGDRGPQGFQGVGVTGASLNGQGELVFTVKDPATGESSTLLPVDIDTSAAINTVEQAAQDGVQKVQDAQASAISAVDQAGKNAGTQAVSEVYSAKDTAIADIATVKSGAESAITAAQQSAVQTVQQSGTTAVGQVQKAQNTATTAIAQAQQNAITAVGDEGDAQVQRLKEIVPQPTADNNGMVVAVQSGAYQLENPAGLVLNDGVIASTSGWSSLQIANALCPPFSVSGPIVQCTPVANSPLDVQVEITPTQEGTGDPSPENVRPIVGWDTVNVTKCGKNLLDISNMKPRTRDGITFQLENGGIHVSGTATSVTDSPIFEMFLPSGTYIGNLRTSTFSWLSSASFVVQKADGSRLYYATGNPFTINEDEKPLYWYFVVDAGANVDEIIYPQIELGSTATPYAPYTGTTATLTLPETIYGGTVDAVTGEGSEEWGCLEFDGTENWYDGNTGAGLTYQLNYSPSGQIQDSYVREGICSHWKYTVGFSETGTIFMSRSIIFALGRIVTLYQSLNEWKSYLAAQAAAGTPVTIVYKLATPTTFQATGGQSLPALPGTNTLYADAGNITVSGASDPIATITSLQNRVSALESAQTEM